MLLLQLGKLGAGHLPVAFAVLFFANLGFTYVVAVYFHHVDPIFPYISADGNTRPESCIFSFLLTISAFLSIIIVCLRCSIVSAITGDENETMDQINMVSSYFGILGGLAMLAVASFQEAAVITVHMSAAVVTFTCGSIYMLLQSYLTIRMAPTYNNRRIGIIRLVLAVGSCLGLVLAISFGFAAAHKFHKYYPSLPTPRPWNRKYWQPGYELHVVSAISEWAMAICHILFILSFSRDFEKLRITFTCRSLVRHFDESRYNSREMLYTGERQIEC